MTMFDVPTPASPPRFPRKHSETRRRTEQAIVRLYPDEHQALKSAATLRGISVGELIRRALKHELEAAK